MTTARLDRLRSLLIASLLLGAAAGMAAAQPDLATVHLTFAEAQRLATRAPTVRLAELALELAQRQLALTAVPIRGELQMGYRWTAGERDLGHGGTIDLTDAGFDPVTLTLSLAAIGPGPAADAIARARAEVLRAEAELAASRRAARLDAVGGFQRALRARDALALARAEADVVGLELEAGRLRQAVGAASAADLERLLLALDRATATVAAAERERDAADRLLYVTLGTTTGPPVGPLPDPRAWLDGAHDVPGSRADVLTAELQLAENARQADGALRDHLPSGALSFAAAIGSADRAVQFGAGLDSRTLQPAVTLSYDPDSGLPGLSGDARSRSFTVALGLRVPLNPAVGHAVAAARVGRERAVAQVDLTRVRAETDIALRRAEFAAAAANADLAQAGADLAAADLAVVEARFAGGHLAALTLRRATLEVERARLEADRAHDATRLAALRLLDAMAVEPADLE
jgi:outer membrane protein TolC